MLKTLVCIESHKKTSLDLMDSNDDFRGDVNARQWNNDDIVNAAANRLLKRESEHKHDFVVVKISHNRMSSEIYHSCGDMCEHTGEYRTFRII